MIPTYLIKFLCPCPGRRSGFVDGMWCPFLGVETDTISHTFRLRLNSRRDSETSNSLNSIAAHDYQFKGMQSQQKEASFNFGLNKTAESHPEHNGSSSLR